MSVTGEGVGKLEECGNMKVKSKMSRRGEDMRVEYADQGGVAMN